MRKQVLDYIFTHCKDYETIPEDILRSIEAELDPEKQKIKSFRQEEIDLTVFIKGYAKRCLQLNRNDLKYAQKKFLQDLCIDEPLHQYLIHHSPMYQISDLILESIQKSTPEEYEYAEAAKIALSMIIFYINSSAMGWPNYLVSNSILIAGEVIDCSRLSENPKINALVEQLLKELLPLALYVGMNMAFREGDLSSVTIYSLLEYISARLMQHGVEGVCQKVWGATSQFTQFARGQIVFGFSLLGFQAAFPEKTWLISLLTQCLKSKDVESISQYFNLTQLAESVNTTLLAEQFKSFSRNAYKAGQPINETATHIINDFYNCMRNKPSKLL
jgi:hypothetical protein